MTTRELQTMEPVATVDFFNGIDNLRAAKSSTAFRYEPWQMQEIVKCSQDIIYFCEKYVTIETADGPMLWGDASQDIEVDGEMKTFTGMWEFQKKFMLMMAEEQNCLAKFPRQCGKSTCTRAYLLWFALFNKSKQIAILANKEDLAIEQLELLKSSYVDLPVWMQMGIRVWNTKNILLGNGSRIIARATSKDAIRGRTVHKLYCDEFAFVPDNIAEAFIRSVFPTISSSKNRNLLITSTPQGMNHFYRLWLKAENGKGSFNTIHIEWNEVPGRTEQWAQEQIDDIGEIAFNQEFRCDFLGSDSTVVNSDYLTKLIKISSDHDPLPIQGLDPRKSGIRIYQKPLPQHVLDQNEWTYVASLDTSMGMKEDATVLQICLVKSNRNIWQVATMSKNDLNVRDFCDKAMPLLKAYHDPQLIIEANGPGENAITIFNNVYMYENMINFDSRRKRLGLVPTNPAKYKAVVLMKAYLEKNLLKVFDDSTVNELSSFGKVGEKKFKGKNGSHDDHVTSLYWIPYFVNTPMYWGKIDDEEINNFTSLLELPNDKCVVGNTLDEEQVQILARTGDPTRSNYEDDVDVEVDQSKRVEQYNLDDEDSGMVDYWGRPIPK